MNSTQLEQMLKNEFAIVQFILIVQLVCLWIITFTKRGK